MPGKSDNPGKPARLAVSPVERRRTVYARVLTGATTAGTFNGLHRFLDEDVPSQLNRGLIGSRPGTCRRCAHRPNWPFPRDCQRDGLPWISQPRAPVIPIMF